MTDTHEPADVWDTLNKALDVDPDKGWVPEPGERLTGTLRRIEYRRTKRGDWLPILHIETTDGSSTTVTAGRRVLVARLIESQVQPNDLIAIQYDGQVTPTGGGNPYFGYRLAVHKVGERGADVFRDPETITDADDLELTPEAQNGGDPWTKQDTGESEDVPF